MNKLTLLSSVAVLALALPAPLADARGRDSVGSAPAAAPTAGSSGRSFGSGTWSHGGGNRGNIGSGSSRWSNGSGSTRFGNGTGGNRWSNGTGNNRWNNGTGTGRWNNGSGRWSGTGHHHHHRHFPRVYYSGFYPYGFGYPWGWYGYPYWGSSAYYSGYYNGSEGYGGSGNVVADVQQELARAGYYRGSIDGVIGPRTRSAIRAFERANGLPVDGAIDRDLLATMGLS